MTMISTFSDIAWFYEDFIYIYIYIYKKHISKSHLSSGIVYDVLKGWVNNSWSWGSEELKDFRNS